ncbi:putative nuclease HARBI1 [Calliphora vicina]|uniref:putative nuclease HARBI1 n=1 Tax=Calliphora vicina TaxID=7373 RepID=UPI00325B26D8
MDLTIAVHFLEDQDSVQINRRELRDMYNVLELPTSQFVANFRVSKDIFCVLLQKFQETCSPNYRSTFIRADVKLATFLRFLATGSYQQSVGNEVISSSCKTSVCRIIAECLDFFENHICENWIKMVRPEDEHKNKQEFYGATGFPGVIGCVDGTHIRIKSPGDEQKHLYYNRKGYYSINVMVICDQKTYIMYVDARHPGANHDAFVWEYSVINQKLQDSFENGKRNTWILGDAGYKLKPYLMTPFRKPNNPHERRYNKKHTSTRNVVERCFGVLKNRFRCIIGSRGLHYNPAKVTKIIYACCALHNMCIFYKCIEPEDVERLVEEVTEEVEEVEEVDEEEANAIRRNIAMNL